MNKTIKEVAELLMYKGPSIGEVLENAVSSNYVFSVEKAYETTIVTINSELAYSTKIKDIYVYSRSGDLIKQSIIIDEDEKTVFDKYSEALQMISNIKNINYRTA